MSPSQRHPEKRPIKCYISHELHLKFSKLAEARGCSMSDLLTQFIIKETKNINLTAEDYEHIAASIRRSVKY